MLLLIAFCLNYLKETLHGVPGEVLSLGSWLWSNNLRREMPDEMSNDSSPKHPDPWRSQTTPDPGRKEQPSVLWPSNLQLHLLSCSWTAVVSLHMWFYVLYLKFNGHLFGSWSECCTKLLSPKLCLDDLKWPLMILPHCKFKEAVTVVLTLPQFLMLKLTKDTHHRPELTPRRDPKPKSKPLNKI